MLVVLTGPTASGKSALALSLALDGPLSKQIEIISMDSAQVYRGMNVGTAKPSLQERKAVAHHLLDLIDPWDSYSAARFRIDALEAAKQIRSAGRMPLIVGGTLLYGRALAGGLSDLPASNPEIRKRIAQEAIEHGWPAMHARLAEIDPQTASRLKPQDAQRISRALELFHMTGKAMSQWIAEHPMRLSDCKDESKSGDPTTPEALTWISLEPSRRAWLHERIGMRFKQMLAEGLVEEVRNLMAQPGMHAGLASMRAVGYRQCLQHLEGDGDALCLEARGIAATRQFAKRQLTWLRSMTQRTVFACDDAQARLQARDALVKALEASAKAADRRPC